MYPPSHKASVDRERRMQNAGEKLRLSVGAGIKIQINIGRGIQNSALCTLHFALPFLNRDEGEKSRL